MLEIQQQPDQLHVSWIYEESQSHFKWRECEQANVSTNRGARKDDRQAIEYNYMI